MVVGGYIRVSSAKQRDESDSPASQRQRLADAGATVFFEDLAVSGFKLKQRRKAVSFQRLQQAIRKREITRLIATRLDRIARRDQVVLELAELCDAYGVEFVTLGSGKVDTSSATGWLGVKVQLMIAEHFSRQLSENIRHGYEGLHAQGIPARSAGSLPFHLQRQHGTRHGVIPSDHWDHARHVVDQVLCGAWLPPQAARYLYVNCGTHGDPKTVAMWLRAPALAGHCAKRDGTIIIRDCWPALVTEDERVRLLLALQQHKRWSHVKVKPAATNALSGLCECSDCGGSLGYHTAKRGERIYRYIRCSKPTCARRNVVADPIERQLHALIGPHVDQLIWQQAERHKTTEPSPELTSWRRELQMREAIPVEFRQPADQMRIAELQGLISNAGSAMGVDQIELQRMREEALDAVKWFEKPPEVRNADLRALVRKVVVDTEKRQIVRVDWSAGDMQQIAARTCVAE